MGWTEKSFGLKQNVLGRKKVFLGWKAEKCLGWKRSILGWKIKGNTQKEKKKRVGAEQQRGKQKQKKEENSGVEAEKKRKRLKQKKGAEQRIFQQLFSFKSSQKNYGEFVYVEFNF